MITKRTVKISEAFGIGIDDTQEFTIYDNFEFNVEPGDVVYITGDSGSGKSLLVKYLASSLAHLKAFGGVITMNDIVDVNEHEVLIESIAKGKDLKDAISILSMAGLNEAFLMLRPYNQLSDGQKYRYQLAKMIDSGKGTWIADEFCSVLDRATAKVVAYTMAKTARKLGKTLIVATTHEDLIADIKPTLYIYKRFGAEVDKCYLQPNAYGPDCSLLKDVNIEESTREEFEQFEQFHYRGGIVGSVRPIYKAVLNNETIGIIVYGYVMPNLKPRSIALPWLNESGAGLSAKLNMLNQIFRRIWRVVVLPKYRSIGLGAKLVRDTMPLVNVAYIETMAVMAHYNPFFEKAGMKRVPSELYQDSDNKTLAAQGTLIQMGFDPDLLSSKQHVMGVLKTLDTSELQKVKDAVLAIPSSTLRSTGNVEKIKAGNLDMIAEALHKHPVAYAYLIWKNEKFNEYPDPEV